MHDRSEAEKRAKNIRLIVLDVDGVLTDGSIVVDEAGRESKRFHVRDGFAIRSWIRIGGKVAVLSGRYSEAVAFRCRELGIAPCIQNEVVKGPALSRIVTEAGVELAATAVLGDDLPELPLMVSCGLGAAVADAVAEVRERAQFVTTAPGGQGAVREFIEFILTAQGHWSDIVSHYSRPIDDKP